MKGCGVAVGGTVGSGEGVGEGANSVRAAATADCSVCVACGPATGSGGVRLVTTRKATKASRKRPPTTRASAVRGGRRRRVRLGRRGGAAAAAALGAGSNGSVRRNGLISGAGRPAGRSSARAKASTDS